MCAGWTTADLALILAFAFCQQRLKKLSVQNLKVGIVISHNKTENYADAKLNSMWNAIYLEETGKLTAAVNTNEDPTELEHMLQSNTYDVKLVLGQSAISTDFHMVAVCNCFNNKFVQQGFRQNAWNTHAKYMTLLIFPEANNQYAKQDHNWPFFL